MTIQDRKLKEWAARDYHKRPENAWVNVFKGVLLAGLILIGVDHGVSYLLEWLLK